jgi:hypothetical protein
MAVEFRQVADALVAVHHFVTWGDAAGVADSPGGGVWIQRTGPSRSKNHLSGVNRYNRRKSRNHLYLCDLRACSRKESMMRPTLGEYPTLSTNKLAFHRFPSSYSTGL